MQMAGAAALRTGVLEPEGFEVLVDFQHIMLVAGAGADDVAGFDIEVLTLGADLCLAGEHEPIFVEVVVMPVETAALAANAEDAGAGDLAPFGTVAGLQGTVGCSHNGQRGLLQVILGRVFA